MLVVTAAASLQHPLLTSIPFPLVHNLLMVHQQRMAPKKFMSISSCFRISEGRATIHQALAQPLFRHRKLQCPSLRLLRQSLRRLRFKEQQCPRCPSNVVSRIASRGREGSPVRQNSSNTTLTNTNEKKRTSKTQWSFVFRLCGKPLAWTREGNPCRGRRLWRRRK